MKLSTGKIAFPIEFDNGDKDYIYFNPSDPDLFIRMKNFETRAQEKIKDIGDVELTAEGVPLRSAQIEAFEKMQNILKEELDYAFGSPVSNVVFKHCSPFAIVNGDYFVVQFVEAITPVIKEKVEEANTEANKRMDKHIGKYKR
jgi:hypothetical protein